MDEKNDSPGREQTDESLRVERERADHALAERLDAIEDDADRVLRRARHKADAVLGAARDKADEQREPAGPASSTAAVEALRTREDEILRRERAAADEGLRREREESAQLLLRLLPLERDKTDRYLLTERARSDDAVANRDDFMGIVSHDLRNLLGGIVMSAAVLAKAAGETDEGRRATAAADRIQRYAARMNRLIGDLVDVASIDAGKLGVTPLPGDCAALIDEAVETFQAGALEKGISLQAQVARRPLPAGFDHDRLLQVLANLIANAIKFTPPGGHIVVRGGRADDALHFSVSDTGQGIPSQMLESVFERFWQVGKDDRRGSGLGLYISKCIVEAHGGHIRAASTPGQGSEFSFTLPDAR